MILPFLATQRKGSLMDSMKGIISGKGILFGFLVIFMCASAFAGVNVVYPVKETVQDNGSVNIGSISSGETFGLAFSTSSGEGFSWTSASIDQTSLPFGWSVSPTSLNDAAITLKISVPQWTGNGSYPIIAVLKGPSGESSSITMNLSVKENLDVSFARETQNETVVGKKVVYRAVITNTSIAPETVKISSTLPSNWFREKTIEVKPNSSEQAVIEVEPLASGNRDFSFNAFSVQRGVFVKGFSSEMKVRPSLKGTLSSMFSGFPLFTFSLLPFQLVDSYLSLLFY